MPNILDFKTVFDFAIDTDAVGQIDSIVQRHALPVERSGELRSLVSAVLKGEADYHQMPTFLGAAFGLDEAKAKLVAADLAGYRLLPLQLYIPGIAQAIISWGGDPTSYPTTVVAKEKVTAEHLIEKFAKDLHLELPEVLMKRFIYLCRGYLTGERTREGTMVLFKRPSTIGGLEMSDAQTLKCLELLDAEKENVEVVEMELGTQTQQQQAKVVEMVEESVEANEPIVTPPVVSPPNLPINGEEIVPEVLPPPFMEGKGVEKEVTPSTIHHELVKTVSQALTTSVPTISGEMIEHLEKKDLEVAKKVIATNQVAEDPIEKEKRDTAVNEVLVPVVELFKKNRCSKQDFTDIATAHVRGRREYLQTESLLRDRCKFDAAEIEVAMKALEAGRKIAGAAQASPPRSQTPPSLPINGEASDSSVLDARFAALTKQVPDAPIESIMPTARVSASRSKEEELALQASKIDPIKTAAAEVASRPEKATVMVSAASAPIATRPSGTMTDVSYMPNLIGPVEEIGTMSPEQFRRLSSDPMEAIRKVEDKLALLQNLSYADRIRGIEAWRKSPVSLLYLSMARAALMANVSLAELAAKKRAAGEETLSPSEISAVVELNRRIGF